MLSLARALNSTFFFSYCHRHDLKFETFPEPRGLSIAMQIVTRGYAPLQERASQTGSPGKAPAQRMDVVHTYRQTDADAMEVVAKVVSCNAHAMLCQPFIHINCARCVTLTPKRGKRERASL